MLLHNGNEDKNQHGHSSGFLAAPGASAVAHSSSDDGLREMDEKTAPACEEIEPFNINVPVFMERTLRMIDSVSDDIVCWSRAGDSFIVKKVLVFEQHLPSFFNHKKFLSFVRQLNFYGFRRVKGKSASRLSPADGAMHGAVAAMAAAKESESESWEEFIHPLFRRGRRDLLVGIKRHKDGGRLKRKQVDSHESGILSDLRADMDALRGDLRTVDGKLDNIMSLLLGMSTGDQGQAGSTKPLPLSQNAADRYAGAAGGGGESSFERGGGSGGSPAATSASTVLGRDREGLNQWRGGGGVGVDGGIHPASQDPNALGSRLGHYVEPRLAMDQQHQQGSERHQLAHFSQQPSPAQRTWPDPTRFGTRWREHGHYHH